MSAGVSNRTTSFESIPFGCSLMSPVLRRARCCPLSLISTIVDSSCSDDTLVTKKFFSMMSRALRSAADTPEPAATAAQIAAAPIGHRRLPDHFAPPDSTATWLKNASRRSPKTNRGLNSIISARRKNSAKNALMTIVAVTMLESVL